MSAWAEDKPTRSTTWRISLRGVELNATRAIRKSHPVIGTSRSLAGARDLPIDIGPIFSFPERVK